MVKDEIIRQGKFTFEISTVNRRGDRPVNEDFTAVEHNRGATLLTVADGLGAHGGGDTAAEIAVNTAVKEYLAPGRAASRSAAKIFRDINGEILLRQTEDVKMKTTLSCVLLKNGRMYGAHLGDTRVYVFKRSGKMLVTADHSEAYRRIMSVGGTSDDIRKSPDRHILLAALGVEKMRAPDIFKLKIEPNTAVMICTDGFWEYVCEEDMAKGLQDAASSREWLEAMLKRHSEKADEYKDNYSAICLRIRK